MQKKKDKEKSNHITRTWVRRSSDKKVKRCTGGTRSSDGELMRLVAGGGAAAGWKVIVGGRWRFEVGSPGGKHTGTDSRQ